MTVEVKKVGNYKIHVKETHLCDFTEVVCVFGPTLIMCTIGVLLVLFNIGSDGHFVDMETPVYGIILVVFSVPVMFALGCIMERYSPFRKPAYYVDTTMYGVGGETILKTTPEQDHLAICRAAQKFEKEILERIKKEDELKEIVGTCK